MKREHAKTNQDINKQRLDYLAHIAVLKNNVGNRVEYISNLELTKLHNIPRQPKLGSRPGIDAYLGIRGILLLAKKQIHPDMCGSIPSHHYDGMPSSRVVSAEFTINDGVATMEKYSSEPETPLSAIIRIDALIIMAGDLKVMGCKSVITDVFVPGKKGAPGTDEPVLINIGEWLGCLRSHRGSGEFGAQPLL